MNDVVSSLGLKENKLNVMCICIFKNFKFLGIPLEMSQPGWLGSLRIAGLYMAGVALGCLGATVAEPTKYLVGASAGVYALIMAHLGN